MTLSKVIFRQSSEKMVIYMLQSKFISLSYNRQFRANQNSSIFSGTFYAQMFFISENVRYSSVLRDNYDSIKDKVFTSSPLKRLSHVASPLACAAFCEAEPDCKAFSYWKRDET